VAVIPEHIGHYEVVIQYQCFGRQCSIVLCRQHLSSCLWRTFQIHGV